MNIYYYDLIKTLIIKELKVRYKNTFFGYMWSILNPLVFAITFYFAFKNSLKLSVDNYLLYLLIGLFPWQYFANAVNQASCVFLVNATLIKKVIFPRYILILGLVGNHAIHFLCTFPVMYFFMWYYNCYPELIQIIGIPILFINQSILIVGLGFILGTLNLFFRDMENLTSVLMNVLFYLTPIIYQKNMLPDNIQFLLMFNPMTWVVESWRMLLLEGNFSLEMVSISFLYNIIFLLIGWIVYKYYEKRFAEVV